jgi:hypothetical protein
VPCCRGSAAGVAPGPGPGALQPPGPLYPVHPALRLLPCGRTPLALPPPPARVETARSDLAPRPKGGARGFT